MPQMNRQKRDDNINIFINYKAQKTHLDVPVYSW